MPSRSGITIYRITLRPFWTPGHFGSSFGPIFCRFGPNSYDIPPPLSHCVLVSGHLDLLTFPLSFCKESEAMLASSTIIFFKDTSCFCPEFTWSFLRRLYTERKSSQILRAIQQADCRPITVCWADVGVSGYCISNGSLKCHIVLISTMPSLGNRSSVGILALPLRLLYSSISLLSFLSFLRDSEGYLDLSLLSCSLPIPVRYLTDLFATYPFATWPVRYLAFSLPVFFATLFFQANIRKALNVRFCFILYLFIYFYLQQNILKMN